MHGKRDRKGNCHVDVGLQSMAVYWGEDLSRRIAAEFNACNYIFEGITFG